MSAITPGAHDEIAHHTLASPLTNRVATHCARRTSRRDAHEDSGGTPRGCGGTPRTKAEVARGARRLRWRTKTVAAHRARRLRWRTKTVAAHCARSCSGARAQRTAARAQTTSPRTHAKGHHRARAQTTSPRTRANDITAHARKRH